MSTRTVPGARGSRRCGCNSDAASSTPKSYRRGTGTFAPAMSNPIEAVVWDYGGVISSPLFRGVDRFEIDMGYPPGSILELLFGEAAYIGVEGRAAGGGDPGDGAASADRSAVTHDWHR